MNSSDTPNLVITGVTGFLGSALAANALCSGCRVLAISRNDAGGRRTRQAVRAAARGFGFDVEPLLEQSLQVVPAELDAGEIVDLCDRYFNRYSVWHSAAQMTYCPSQLADSMNTNLVNTAKLYQAFSRTSGCQRFYYVSTAYTGGFGGTDVAESLHYQPRLINSYQTSKWAAEMSLAAACGDHLPVTLFRPSIIVGHERSGWHGASRFGFYGFLAASFHARSLRGHPLEMDLRGDAQPNFVPINRVVDDALLLQASERSAPHLQIVHSVAKEGLSNREIADIIAELWGVDIRLRTPSNRLSRKLNEALIPNQPFANHTFRFAQRTLPAIAREDYRPYQLHSDTLQNLIHSFAAEHESPGKRANLAL